MGNGYMAMQLLERTFGQSNANDATNATLRLLTCHIDPRAWPSVEALLSGGCSEFTDKLSDEKCRLS